MEIKIRLTSITLISGLALFSFECSQSGQKEEAKPNAGAAVKTSTFSEKPGSEPENQELLAVYAEAKKEWFKAISENEKMIASLKSTILATKIKERGDMEKKVNLLEQLNNRQKTEIALFKPYNKENWERFKKILTEDLDKVSKDLKALKK